LAKKNRTPSKKKGQNKRTFNEKKVQKISKFAKAKSFITFEKWHFCLPDLENIARERDKRIEALEKKNGVVICCPPQQVTSYRRVV
jgi:hypothetical protein